MQTPSPPSAGIKVTPRTKRGKSLCISVVDLRRSERLHGITKGFKSLVCRDQNCLGCTSNPPLLSASVVRDLGASFCKVNPDLLSDDKLGAKLNKKGAVTKPKTKKAKKSKGSEEDAATGTVAKPKEKKAKKPKDSKEALAAGAKSKRSKK